MVFGLLFATFQSSAEANEVIKPSDEDYQLLLDEWQPSNPLDYTEGLNDFFQDFIPSTYGIINDDTGSVSYKIDYYAGLGFGGWRSETNWTTSSDIATNKVFTVDNVLSGLGGQGALYSATQLHNLPSSAYFSPSVGYTISFVRSEGDALSKGSKIAINLNMLDTAVSSNIAQIQFNGTSGSSSSNYDLYAVTSVSNGTSSSYYYGGLGGHLLDLTNGSKSPTINKMGFVNHITVGGLDLDGNDVIFDSYDNMESLTLDLKLTTDVQYVYVDVEYSGKWLYDKSSYGSLMYMYLPLVYNFDLSGSLELDESGVNTGLLQGIIEWLRNILAAIRELPQKIVDLLKVGLQQLFVPSPDFISGKFEEFKLLAESKLGFLFTMLDMVVDLFTTLSTNISEPMETLTIPRLALPFPYTDSGYIVLWEDMTFDVFPDGLDVLLNLVHLVTSIVLITATINFAVNYIRRFFEKG